MDLWQHAKRIVDSKDLELAWALGFDFCQHCGEWVHEDVEEGTDCVGCGWYCPTCSEDVTWEWCDRCGLHYCHNCYHGGEAEEFVCEVCAIGETFDF